MKTPQEWMKQTSPPLYGSAIDRWIEAIQKDAFESGRVAGLYGREPVWKLVDAAMELLKEISRVAGQDKSWRDRYEKLCSKVDVESFCDSVDRMNIALIKDAPCSKNTP